MAKLNSITNFIRALTFRAPLRVSAVQGVKTSYGITTFPLCPRCLNTMEREFQSYCDRCGQALDWNNFDNAVIILPVK